MISLPTVAYTRPQPFIFLTTTFVLHAHTTQPRFSRSTPSIVHNSKRRPSLNSIVYDKTLDVLRLKLKAVCFQGKKKNQKHASPQAHTHSGIGFLASRNLTFVIDTSFDTFTLLIEWWGCRIIQTMCCMPVYFMKSAILQGSDEIFMKCKTLGSS